MINPPARRTPAAAAPPGNSTRVRLMWLQQAATAVYLFAGAFLLGLYWWKLRRGTVLMTGIMFVLYSVYRFFLVRRSAGRWPEGPIPGKE